MATMKWSQLMCFVLLFLTSQVVLGNLFNSVLDDVESCNSACDKTYPLHTYPKTQHAESCKRGCRFFSIADFINEQGDMNSTKKACESSCAEAYTDSEDKFACTSGCTNQYPVSAKKRKEEQSEHQSLHLLSPFMYVQRMYGSVMDRMTNYVSVSWSYYVQQDDGKVVVVQSGPKFVSSDLGSASEPDSKDGGKDTIRFGPMSNYLFRHTGGSGDNTFELDDVLNAHGADTLPEISSRNDDMDGELTASVKREEVMGMDWLGCVSRKSGLPRWFLGMTIFLSSFAMIWLCFATTATAPEHKVHKVNYYGDLDYLRLYDPHEKVKIQPSPEYDAPPLPVKVHLEKL